MTSNLSKEMAIKTLKRDLLEKQNKLSKIKEKNTPMPVHKKLMEDSDLEQAKLIIASQDVIEKLQKSAERLMEINSEEIMPISDSMKAAFGPEVAQKFEHVASEAIQKAVESVRAARDTIDNVILQVQGNSLPEEQSDMANYTPSNSDETIDVDVDDNQENNDTILSTDTEDEVNSPLGRNLRDSVDYDIIGIAALTESSFDDLYSNMLRKANQTMKRKDFIVFGNKLKENSERNKNKTAGWIYHSLNESYDINLLKAKAIASIIESNIKDTGFSKTSKVVASILGNNITEDTENNILSIFENHYGCNPAIYAIKIKKSLSEDTGSIDSTVVKGINPANTTGGQSTTPAPNTAIQPPSQQNNLKDQAIAKIASKVASNQSILNQPVSSVTSDLAPAELTAINNMIGSNTNTSVADFLKNNS